MAVAALVVSIVAVLVAIASVVFTARADRRAGQAERRDEERIERERREADEANRARLAIWANGSSATPDERRFAYIIRNHGKVTAHDVHVWLYDEDGLVPDESVDNHGVIVPLDVDPTNVRFAYRWDDGKGHHKRLTYIPPMF
jgi:hypothetical protein